MQLRMSAALCGVLLASTIALAQERDVVAFEAPAGGNKYTQQHILEVGDVLEMGVRQRTLGATFVL